MSSSKEVTHSKHHCKLESRNEEPTMPSTREEASVETPVETLAESPATHKYVCKWTNPFHSQHKIYHIATVSSAFALIEFLISAFYCPHPPQTTRVEILFWILQYAGPVIYSGISQIVLATSSFHSSKHPVAPAVLCGCTLTACLGLIWYKTMLVMWYNIELSFTGAGTVFNWIGVTLLTIIWSRAVLFLLPGAWYGFRKEWQPRKNEDMELG